MTVAILDAPPGRPFAWRGKLPKIAHAIQALAGSPASPPPPRRHDGLSCDRCCAELGHRPQLVVALHPLGKHESSAILCRACELDLREFLAGR